MAQYKRIQARTPLGDANKAVLDKLIRDQKSNTQSSGNIHRVIVDPLAMRRISREIASNTADSDAIMQVLPDMEHVVQILIGTILNPKDMAQTDLQILVDNTLFNSELSAGMLEVVRTFFKAQYKIDTRLDKILEEPIAKSGAFVQAVIPENALDLIINGQRRISNEDFGRVIENFKAGESLGILGPGTYVPQGLTSKVSLESLDPQLRTAVQTVGFAGNNLTVSDNFHLLKKPQLSKTRRKQVIASKIRKDSVSLEDSKLYANGLTPEQIDKLYTQRTNQLKGNSVIVERPEMLERASVGHPFVMDLSADSVIPVYVPGRPHEHVGYFIPIEPSTGRPLSHDKTRDHYNELKANWSNGFGTSDNSSELLRLTREAVGGTDATNSYDLEQLNQSYASIIEADLKKRLVNGSYREEFDLGMSDEIRRIMLTRHLKNQNTQLIYIPAELVIYIAFYYDRNGAGISMLSRSKILASLRSVLMFAEGMGNVRNAVGRKKVNINIDPRDPDPTATISEIQQLILESGRSGFPIAAPDPGQTLDYLNRAGFDFAINASDENYHQMSVDYDDYTTNITAGNPEFQDRLKKMHYSSMGVPPEKVDPENGSDFATSIVKNDLLMARRVRNLQKPVIEGLTKFIQVYTLNSSILVNELLAYIDENRNMIPAEYSNVAGTDLVEDFIQALHVKLPEPDADRIEQMTEALGAYEQLLEKVLEYYVSEDLFPEEFLVKTGSVEKAIKVIKAHFMRQFINNNGILPELNILYEMEEKTPVFNLFDVSRITFESLGNAIQEYISKLEDMKEEWGNKFTEGGDNALGGYDVDDDTSDIDSGMDDTESEFGGMDDLPSDEEPEDTTFDGDDESPESAGSIDEPSMDEVEETPETPEEELSSETDDAPEEIPEEEEEPEAEEEKKDEEEDDIPRF